MYFNKNDIDYFQDMRFLTGIPVYVDFRIEESEEDYKLTAPKFGGKPYGNGAIFIKKSLLSEKQKQSFLRFWLKKYNLLYYKHKGRKNGFIWKYKHFSRARRTHV